MSHKPIAVCLSDDLWAILEKYESQGLSNCEVIGILESIKFDVMSQSRDALAMELLKDIIEKGIEEDTDGEDQKEDS